MILLEFFVEEPSTEAALINLVPLILADIDFEFDIYTFQGKKDLLRKLPSRIRAYKHWISDNQKIIVLVDRDEDDCRSLKAKLEEIAHEEGLTTPSTSRSRFQVLTRIAIEELEAWFFGDVEAIRSAYPRVSDSLGQQSPYRDPDAIRGGTWERLEVELSHYHPGGLEKIRAANEISQHMDPDRNRSHSFRAFRDGLRSIFK